MKNDEGIKLGFFEKLKLSFRIAVLAILIFFEDIFRYEDEEEDYDDLSRDEEEDYDDLSRDQKHEEDF